MGSLDHAIAMTVRYIDDQPELDDDGDQRESLLAVADQ